MTTQNNVVEIEPNLFAEHARVELELEIATSLQQKTKQASIWMFNAWCDTDALLDREASKDLIERLESLAIDVDTIKIDVDTVVKSLRDQKRKLTKKLKSKAFSQEAKAEKSKVEELSSKQAEEVAANYLEAEEAVKKPDLKVVKSGNASKSKAKNATA